MGIEAALKKLERAAAAGEPAAAPAAQPRRWWQWLLLYPAAAGALFTAVPGWIDSVQAAWNGVANRTNAEAERQQALWEKNVSCWSAPFAWHNNPSNVRVNATTCPSGDVLVRVSTPGPDSRTFLEWVELSRILGRSGTSLIPQAHAATLTAGFSPLRRELAQSRSARLYNAAYQPMAMVVCHRFLDQRHLLRHIRTPQGCFDEVIDTLNGAVVQRAQVPCRGGC